VENIFIQKIFQITERILRRDMNDALALKELKAHLKKAEQMNFQHYEVEVLNTLGILYSMQDDGQQAKEYWMEALEKAQHVNDADLSVKLSNNLAEQLLDMWEVEQAIQYADRGLSIVKQHQMKTLTTLYIYGTIIACHMALGQFEQAEQIYKVFWEMAQEATLQKYSRYEYAQIITLMHETRVQLDLVARNDAAFQSDIKTLASFVEQMNRDDFSDALIIQGLYYALIIHNDESAAKIWEQNLLLRHPNGLRLPQLLKLTNFLFYNQQCSWAKKYAQQILHYAEDAFVPPSVIARAHEIANHSCTADKAPKS
jgi:tetratricopeptide (TPR) repeat protein